MVTHYAAEAKQEEHVPELRAVEVESLTISFVDDNLGQWFSKDPPSQSSSLDSLTSYYCGKLSQPAGLASVKAATSRKPTICDLNLSSASPGEPTLLFENAPSPGNVSNPTSDPDLRAYNEFSTAYLKSAPVWEKLEKRHGGNHSRSHSLASPPSGALRRRQTTRRHAIYGGTGLPGIPVPFDDPEETKVNPARATIASFDSNKAVCAISERSFSDSPTKDAHFRSARLASDSPTKPLVTTPIRARRFFDGPEDDSDLCYDLSITAVSSGSCDELDRFSPVKKSRRSIEPLKIRTPGKRTGVEAQAKQVVDLRTDRGAKQSKVLDHLPMMRELLDLVDEATKSWEDV
ncbi:hypothetical protein DAEQUDRAFT_767508 [Daedalea quercina L-15889]|uniref:Uncharacterized protein n=1 Tax=Daedalea quercina L-15889 TaxID=1314783 RepID=A0A165NHP0_9APHY|nr:hypothetical protein DAEQUDRAFT_767508 [Daedalea quercina L-15889]